ncbi:MAG: Lrp/AsnC family transcriptional regulator, partial [Nanoarchaeota archaeon]|nr:Lrp/AsnC family transcriptional regulator [Nanoarchaeota archaeon]
EKATVTTLQISHATREYLGEKKSPKKEYIEYNIERSAESIDETDKQILHTIANNARMSIIEIAKLAKTTARIVQYRLKEMKRKKIILAYKVTINPAKIGKMLCKACFYLGAADRKRIKEFMKYLHNIEEGIWPQKILGPWDVELDMEVSSYDRFNEVMMDIKEQFGDIIINDEFTIVSKEYKLDFYPGCLREIK